MPSGSACKNRFFLQPQQELPTQRQPLKSVAAQTRKSWPRYSDVSKVRLSGARQASPKDKEMARKPEELIGMRDGETGAIWTVTSLQNANERARVRTEGERGKKSAEESSDFDVAEAHLDS